MQHNIKQFISVHIANKPLEAICIQIRTLSRDKNFLTTVTP